MKTEEGLALAKEFGMAFFETSALDGSNCHRALQILLQDIHATQQQKHGKGGSTKGGLKEQPTVVLTPNDMIANPNSCCLANIQT